MEVVLKKKIDKKLAEELEMAYYELEAIKVLVNDVNSGVIVPSDKKKDDLFDKYSEAVLAYQVAWNKAVARHITNDYAKPEYQASVNFETAELTISK